MPELRCGECSRFVHSDKYSEKILIGDSFYDYTCPNCSPSGERFERLQLSWSNLVQLVLYHLWMGGERKHRYFRFKEDICGTIEEHWDDLIPTKTKNSNWYGSVSSILSTNDKLFASGVAIKGAPGWWALHHWEPPIPPLRLSLKRSYSHVEEELTVSSGEDEKPIKITENQSGNELINSAHFEDLVVDESETDEEEGAEEVDEKGVKNGNNLKSAQSIVPSAALKQQLLERLLMMDSSLLQNAIKKAKAKKMAEIGKTAHIEKADNKSKEKEDSHQASSAVTVDASSKVLPVVPEETQKALEPFASDFKKFYSKIPVIRASPYENDLIKRCNRVDYREFKSVARLRRKLFMRRQRRAAQLGLFDLDNWMYLFLKSPEAALSIGAAQNSIDTKEGGQGDDLKCEDFPINFDPQSIPYVADPTKSLYVKLTGLAAIYGTCPYPITSPFSGKLLPEFIEESEAYEAQISVNVPKLCLLNELKSHFVLENVDEGELSDLVDHFPVPSKFKASLNTSFEKLTLKFTNLRREFVGQLNDLLSDAFWPGIDVSEALEYPDYAIVAIVGLSVVGCAICNPDGYLSYLYVRPDFEGHGLAKKLLGILLPLLCPLKDITLHVSVANDAAMLLYQRIGFKPEEFIVNFYDKYLDLSLESSSPLIRNKNAFFMRLRR